jgi:DNA replication protein dnaD
MTAVARLIKAKTISFTEEMIKNYSKLKLTEIETMLLIHLYHQLDTNNNLLSVKNLTLKMSLNEEQLSNCVIELIQKGYIELVLNEGEEVFKLDGTYEALARVLDEQEEEDMFKNRQDLLSQIVLYIETTYAKLCTPADLMIINNWLDLGYNFQEIKRAVLDSLKAKKLHLKYADAILANHKKQVERETVAYDEDIKKMLDEMYVKK